MELVTAFALSLLTGLSLGMLGSGGAIIIIPILVYIARVDAQAAIGMSLVIVGSTSLAGGIINSIKGKVHRKAILFFTSSGIPGAYLGSLLTHHVSSSTLMILFGSLMIVVGMVMLFRKETQKESAQCYPARCLGIGFFTGVLTGFLGVGGGFLIVPALVLFGGLETSKAVGSSLLIVAINSFSGLIGHITQLNLDWKLTGMFSVVTLVGMFTGLQVGGNLPEKTLKKIFSLFVLVVGCVILAINLSSIS